MADILTIFASSNLLTACDLLMKNLISVILIVVATAVGLRAQDVQAIAERIDRQRFDFPQEKIHVMTDRGRYLAGDTIWFRAWVVDAATHLQVDASQFVYVQLVSPTDSVMTRVKIHPDGQGTFTGYLPLSIDIPEGRYQLTAYTMFMQSVGEQYFYRQPVDVEGLASIRRRIVSRCVRYDNEVDVTLRYENTADDSMCPHSVFSYLTAKGEWKIQQHSNSTKEAHFSLKGDEATQEAVLVAFDNYAKYITLPPPEAVDVTFYPEGGYLIPDVENLVTFKALNTNPNVKTDNGELVDADGRVVAQLRVEHDGMGIVRFTPRVGGVYTARWKDNFDEYVTANLPQVRPEATVVQVRRYDDGRIGIHAVGARADGALVVLQQRGQMLAAGYDTLTVREQDLPAGVVQAMLFDDEMHCLSERLFFASGDMPPMPEIVPDRDTYGDRERVKVEVDLSQFVWEDGNYAVSVIDSHATTPTQGNILANLLLQSELRGSINEPEYYFEQTDSTDRRLQARHLDMLMLTQGWRRYDIPRVLRGLVAQPQYPIERSQVVTGRVLSEWRKRPVANAQISLIAPRADYSAIAITDSLGEFSISMPLLPDSVECIVMAENTKGKKLTSLELDPEVFPNTYYYVADGKPTSIQAADLEEQTWRLEQSGDWRHIMLNELLVTAIRPRAVMYNPRLLTRNKLDEQGLNSVGAAVRAIPGIIERNGEVYTMGGHDRDRVTIVLDGEPVMQNYSTDDDLLAQLRIYNPAGSKPPELTVAEGMVSMQDVEYVYFAPKVHGGGTLYIQRRADYATRGHREPSVFLKIAFLLGVQQPAEFYSPRYDKGNAGIQPGTDLRSVLYWNPRVTVNHDGTSTFDFYTSDAHNTSYIMTIEGIGADGSMFHTTRRVTKR